jgi:uncharacterized protein YkwD
LRSARRGSWLRARGRSRRVALAGLVLALLGTAGGASAQSYGTAHAGRLHGAGVDVLQSRLVLRAINAVRAHAGLRPLALDATLVRAAEAHSLAMAQSGLVTHADFAHRIRASGAPGRVFGENVAWSTELEPAAQSVVLRWLASPRHRANVLGTAFGRVGVGVAYGSLDDRPVTMVTAAFAGS